MREIEILAPAGSLDSLYASFKLGADAVYVGTSRFGARAYADNPGIDELREALGYAHLRGKKIYLTVNTLLDDKELEEDLFSIVAPLYEAGLDACIVQDLGVLSFLHENFPDMDLHASTQMTLFSGEEAELYRPYGITRYVPARELTIEEIREARAQTELEIEVFVHGALCYCYSGQCLMSEVIGGRSGNRGMCAQPCRLPFDSPYGRGHLFSTKDTCTLLHIPEMVEAGIDSFKIEGRMKKKEYSAYLSSLYRHYVDVYQTEGAGAYHALVENSSSELWRDIRRSQDIYNRGGFSQSYLFEKNKEQIMFPEKSGHYGVLVGTVVKADGRRASFQVLENLHYQDILEFRLPDGTQAYEYTVKDPAKKGDTVTANIQKGSRIFPGQKVYRTRNAALLAWVDKEMDAAEDRLPLTGVFRGRIGQQVSLTVEGRTCPAAGEVCRVTIEGPVLQRAQKRPVTAEDIQARLSKMGQTCYLWEDLVIELEEGGFLPLGEVNQLRRQAVGKWEKAACFTREGKKPVLHEKKEIPKWEGPVLISVSNPGQLQVVCQIPEEQAICHVKLEDYPVEEWSTIPAIIGKRPAAISFPRILRGEGYRQFQKIWKKAKLWQTLNISVVVINSHRSLLLAREYLPQAVKIADDNFYHHNRRAMEVCRELGMYPSVPKGYGRTAVMVTEGCLKRTMGHCDGKREWIPVKNRGKDEFVVVNHCNSCYNTIYTKEAHRKKVPGSCVRLDFTWEPEEDMRKVMKEWNLL